MKKKDLVVIPPAALTDDAWIGEFIDGPEQRETMIVERRYGSDGLPARRVKWLGTIPKNKLPPTILEQLRKPLVLVQVDSKAKSIFYERAYQSFFVNDQGFTVKFDTKSEEYTSKNDFLLQAFSVLSHSTREL